MDPINFIKGYFSLGKLFAVGLIFSVVLLGYAATREGITERPVTTITDQAALVSSSAWRDFWCDLRSLVWLDCIDAPTPPVEYAEVTKRQAEDNITDLSGTSSSTDAVLVSTQQSSTPTAVVQNTTNEYVTNPVEKEIVREVIIRDGFVDTSRFITRDEYNNQVDAIMRSIENSGGGGLPDITSETLEDLADVTSMTQSTGDLLYWTGSGWGNIATSSLGISSSLWSQSGSDISYTSGNVYIGTTSTSSLLTVAGPATITGTTTFAGGNFTINADGSLLASSRGVANSFFVGTNAGSGATSATFSNFFGYNAGTGATNAFNSNFFGYETGFLAEDATQSNFIGDGAGYSATNAEGSNFIGASSGYEATDAAYSNFFGYAAGTNATNATNAIFIGTAAGQSAENAARAIFIGLGAGDQDTVNNTGSSASTSIAIGQNAGTGGFSDSIALGHGVENSAAAQLNIGNVLYATGLYASDTQSSTPTGGFVGIGTASPLAHLEVANEDNEALTTLLITNTGFGGSQIVFRGKGVIPEAGTYASISAPLFASSPAGTLGGITFSTKDDDSDTVLLERMIIKYNGNVGIGESDPGSKLSVSGGATIGASYTTTTAPTDGLLVEGNVGIGTSTPSSMLTVVGSPGTNPFTIASSTGSSMLTVGQDGSAVFVGSGGTCTINGSGACSSDERLKTGFKSLLGSSALEKLATLRTGTYNWADPSWNQDRNMGVLAQDLLVAFPELVGEAPATFMGETHTYYTVNYAGLTVPLISGVNELNLKLEDLATTTTFTELKSNSLTKRFFNKLIAWFSDTANGIGTMVASVFNATELICVDGECLSAADIRELKDSIDSKTVGLGDGGKEESVSGNDGGNNEDAGGGVAVGDATPVVTLVGDAEITLELGDAYEELEATAVDAAGTDISESVVISGDTVDTNTLGTYVITYTATDAAGTTGSTTQTVIITEKVQPGQDDNPADRGGGGDDESIDKDAAEGDAPSTSVEGCTDSEALNYNEDATENDGSCEYEEDAPEEDEEKHNSEEDEKDKEQPAGPEEEEVSTPQT